MHRSTCRCSLILYFEFLCFTDVKHVHFNVSNTFPSGLFLFLVKAAVMILCGFLFMLNWVVTAQMTEGALLVSSQRYCAQRLKFYILLDSILFWERMGLNVQQEYFTTYWIGCKMFSLAIITQAAKEFKEVLCVWERAESRSLYWLSPPTDSGNCPTYSVNVDYVVNSKLLEVSHTALLSTFTSWNVASF